MEYKESMTESEKNQFLVEKAKEIFNLLGGIKLGHYNALINLYLPEEANKRFKLEDGKRAKEVAYA